MEALRTRADAYVADGLLTLESAKKIIEVIEQERRAVSYLNDGGEGQQEPQQSLSSNMNVAELRAELRKREALMQQGSGDGITDQWRVYCEITDSLANGRWLRMIVQASAGTGKSFLLTSVFLYCLVNGICRGERDDPGYSYQRHDDP